MSLTGRDLIVILVLLALVAAIGAAAQLAAPAWAPLATLVAALGAVLIALFDVYRRDQETFALGRDHPGENYRQIEALFSLFALLRIDAPLPAMRGPAISPDFALTLMGLIRTLRPHLVLEAGAGVSTLIAGYALKAAGQGRLLSIEEDAQYAERTRQAVADHGLQDYVEVVHAPLTSPAGRPEMLWYDLRALDGARDIDLLVVDGPRQNKRSIRDIRYPALPVLYPRLSARAAVLVDDCQRQDEREIVQRWLREHPDLRAERSRGEKQHVTLRRGPQDGAPQGA